jgi:integrin beta 1
MVFNSTVLATDAGFHQALDGKLAGIIIPNDGKCHLAKNGSYTHSTIQDYPSIPHINRMAKEHSMNIIFAVTSGVIEIYKKLVNFVSGSYVAELKSDSSNIVELIKQQYKTISTTIQLKDDARDGVKIKYESRCTLNSNKPLKDTNKCDNVPLGENVEFTVTVTATSCPADSKDWIQNLTVIFQCSNP